MCEGHAERDLIMKMVQKATMAEQGNTVSVSDAEYLISSDVRFATEAQTAAEKLHGWSCVMV